MKKTAIALLCACAASVATARVITPAEALGRISPANHAPALNRTETTVPSPSLTVSCTDGLPALYIFSDQADSGFVMLSADSEAEPIVGYADSGSFNPDSIPDNMKAWLDFYAAEIRASRSAAAGSRALRVSPRPQRAPIAPIAATRWNQSEPYNMLCPEGTVTGCVATAMAQVLRVMEYPEKCSGGTYSYTAKNLERTIELDFDQVSLDWANMTDRYGSASTDAENKAVATLMYAVGVASQMNYGPSSGTSVYSLAEGLMRNFGFSRSLTVLSRDWYQLYDWEDLIYAELENGMPVYYDGGNDSNAHAFVVDGYSEDGFFHLNWGWGGMSDGYFRLSALDPDSQGIGGSAAGYNFYQHVIVGLAPKGSQAEEDALMHNLMFSSDSPLTADVTSAYLNETVSFSGGSYNIAAINADDVTLTVKFTSLKDGSVTYAQQGLRYPSLPPNTGFSQYSVQIPALKQGEYTVTRAVLNTFGKAFDVLTPAGLAPLHATVTNTRITFDPADECELDVTMNSVPDHFAVSSTYPIGLTVTNNGQSYHHGGIRVCLSAAADPTQIVAVLDHKPLDLQPGETVSIEAYCTPTPDIQTGEYRLTATDSGRKTVYASCPITLTAEEPATVSFDGLRCISPALDGLHFQTTGTCTDGYFSKSIYLYIFDPDLEPGVMTSTVTPVQFIKKGETATIDIRMEFTEGTVGKRYVAAIYQLMSDNTLDQLCGAIYFTLGEAGIETAVMPGADDAAAGVDLLGRPMADPSAPGLHITPAGKTLRLR